MLAAIIASSVARPASYHDTETSSAASISMVAASSGFYGSFGYHDI
jgi:hypothetical protein